MRHTLGFAEPAPQAPAPMVMVYVKEPIQWEYKQIIRDLQAGEKAPTEEELNQLGQDGWELTSAFSRFTQLFFYFKRSVKM
jgi:hypothetical protein